MKKRTTHYEITRATTLVGIYCGFAAAALACLALAVAVGPDAINAFFGG